MGNVYQIFKWTYSVANSLISKSLGSKIPAQGYMYGEAYCCTACNGKSSKQPESPSLQDH